MSSTLKAGSGRLNAHGKKAVARSMYAKGRSFLAAAALLDRGKGYEYVVLHLLCQGTEIVLKALLLQKDYDQYQPQLRRLGHNLEALASAAVTEFGVKPPREAVRRELAALSSLYSTHRLRYGTFYDVLVDPATIPRERVVRTIVAAMRLADRHASRAAA